MEKLLKELISEIKKNEKERSKNHKELINYLALQSQIQRSILNLLLNFDRRENGNAWNNRPRNSKN